MQSATVTVGVTAATRTNPSFMPFSSLSLFFCLRDVIIIRQIGPARTGILRSRPLKCKEGADRTVFCETVL